MLASDWDMRVSPLQGLGDLCGRLTWASARRTRSSPGCHMAGLRPCPICGLKAREVEAWAGGPRTGNHQSNSALKRRDIGRDTKRRQAVEVAVEPLVLAHDVPGGLQECSERLPSGGLLLCGANHFK